MTAVAMHPPSPSRLAGLRSAADYLGTIVRHLAGNPSSLFGLVVITVLIVLAVLAPLIATQDPPAEPAGRAAAAVVGASFSAPTRSGGTCSAGSSTARASP